ncbi:hypothetical protein Tco_1318567 [Tanacetum coccineum]
MSPENMCHGDTNYLTEKYVGPTLSLGIVAGERIPSERSSANIPSDKSPGKGIPSDKSPRNLLKCRRDSVTVEVAMAVLKPTTVATCDDNIVLIIGNFVSERVYRCFRKHGFGVELLYCEDTNLSSVSVSEQVHRCLKHGFGVELLYCEEANLE